VPEAGQRLHTDRDFLIVGYVLDKSAKVNQGAQGSGIERVQLFMDQPPNATPMADAEVGFTGTSTPDVQTWVTITKSNIGTPVRVTASQALTASSRSGGFSPRERAP